MVNAHRLPKFPHHIGVLESTAVSECWPDVPKQQFILRMRTTNLAKDTDKCSSIAESFFVELLNLYAGAVRVL